MRVLIALIGIAVLGCSASKLALVGLTTAVAAETIGSAVEAEARREREEERERRHQQSSECCGKKVYDSTLHVWRCTGCDDHCEGR